MQIDLSELFITMPARYGKLQKGNNYTLQEVLDHIDELEDDITALEDDITALERERDDLRDEISDMKEQVAMYYRPASQYEITETRP